MHNLVLSPIDPQRLIDDISDRVTANLLAAQSGQVKPEIIDGESLTEKLGITRQTLGRWRKQKRIPFIQHGGVIRYDLNEVLEALKKKGGIK